MIPWTPHSPSPLAWPPPPTSRAAAECFLHRPIVSILLMFHQSFVRSSMSVVSSSSPGSPQGAGPPPPPPLPSLFASSQRSPPTPCPPRALVFAPWTFPCASSYRIWSHLASLSWYLFSTKDNFWTSTNSLFLPFYQSWLSSWRHPASPSSPLPSPSSSHRACPCFSPLWYITIIIVIHRIQSILLRWSFLVPQLPFLTMLKKFPTMKEDKWFSFGSRHLLEPFLGNVILHSRSSPCEVPCQKQHMQHNENEMANKLT